MQGKRIDRRPRGRYAQLICQGCRSRKIKCVLPDPDNVGTSGVPQVAEKSCQRCRNLGLECIVEHTILGRPTAKRARRVYSKSDDPAILSVPDVKGEEHTRTLSSLQVKEYFYSEAVNDTLVIQKDCEVHKSKQPSKQDVFLSMIEPAYFFSLTLANNQSFGAAIIHATSRWNMALPDLVSSDMASSLDKCLVWHRFFLLQTPKLVNLRNRLTSDQCASTNSATNLLFALLCLIALETIESLFEQHAKTTRSIKVAVSIYGQAFIFSPPTHQDSVLVCLLLSEYKPTVLASSQVVTHRTVKSELYINLAYRIAERLKLLPAQSSADLTKLEAADFLDLEHRLIGSLSGLQLYYHEAFLDSFSAKPLPAMRHVLSHMKPHIDLCQNALKHHRWPPNFIYHIQCMVGNYTLMEALADLKHSWYDLNSLSMVVEEVERKCMELTEYSNHILADLSGHGKDDEKSVVRSLLEMRFHSVFVSVCGGGIFYAMVLKARLEGGRADENPEFCCHEAVQLGTQVIDSVRSPPNERMLSISTFLDRFGTPYPSQLMAILERFIECSESLRIDGIAFRPPPRHLVLEIVFHCKNVVENNIIQLKGFGKLHPDFNKQLDLFAKCARQIEAMATSPWNSADAAFASGCVYAASSKLISELHDLMKTLKRRTSEEEDEKKQSSVLDTPTDSGLFNGLEYEFSSEGWDLWPHLGQVNMFETLQDQSEWPSTFTLFPELASTAGGGWEYSVDERIGQ